jgi:hypothetical protein
MSECVRLHRRPLYRPVSRAGRSEPLPSRLGALLHRWGAGEGPIAPPRPGVDQALSNGSARCVVDLGRLAGPKLTTASACLKSLLPQRQATGRQAQRSDARRSCNRQHHTTPHHGSRTDGQSRQQQSQPRHTSSRDLQKSTDRWQPACVKSALPHAFDQDQGWIDFFPAGSS